MGKDVLYYNCSKGEQELQNKKREVNKMYKFAIDFEIQSTEAVNTVKEAIDTLCEMRRTVDFNSLVTVYNTTTKKHYLVNFFHDELVETHYNTIYTIEEYMEQGFTREEAEMVREHDIIFNKDVDEEATEEERARMFEIIRILDL